MKTTRIREKIKKFLGDRPRNTAEILEYINSTMRHGTTSQQLGNVLSKDKDIVKVGYICLLYTSPSPRDRTTSRMPSSA